MDNIEYETDIQQSIDDILDELQSLTPENIAAILFSKLPDDPLTKQMLICCPDDEEILNKGTYLHEILLTILLEGILKLINNLITLIFIINNQLLVIINIICMLILIVVFIEF